MKIQIKEEIQVDFMKELNKWESKTLFPLEIYEVEIDDILDFVTGFTFQNGDQAVIPNDAYTILNP